MIKGITKSGFVFNVAKERLNNYELLESISELESNPLVLSKVVNLLLGEKQAIALKNHVRTKDGIVPADKMTKEITEIFQSKKETKNS